MLSFSKFHTSKDLFPGIKMVELFSTILAQLIDFGKRLSMKIAMPVKSSAWGSTQCVPSGKSRQILRPGNLHYLAIDI